jgi:hypothetical protein
MAYMRQQNFAAKKSSESGTPARYTVEWRPERPSEYVLRTTDDELAVMIFRSWGEALVHAIKLDQT